MPYFPPTSTYWCPNCYAYFQDTGVSCLVNHPPGSCCHKYDVRVDELGVMKMTTAPPKLKPLPFERFRLKQGEGT